MRAAMCSASLSLHLLCPLGVPVGPGPVAPVMGRGSLTTSALKNLPSGDDLPFLRRTRSSQCSSQSLSSLRPLTPCSPFPGLPLRQIVMRPTRSADWDGIVMALHVRASSRITTRELLRIPPTHKPLPALDYRTSSALRKAPFTRPVSPISHPPAPHFPSRPRGGHEGSRVLASCSFSDLPILAHRRPLSFGYVAF